jgi:hypothetical protein
LADDQSPVAKRIIRHGSEIVKVVVRESGLLMHGFIGLMDIMLNFGGNGWQEPAAWKCGTEQVAGNHRKYMSGSNQRLDREYTATYHYLNIKNFPL